MFRLLGWSSDKKIYDYILYEYESEVSANIKSILDLAFDAKYDKMYFRHTYKHLDLLKKIADEMQQEHFSYLDVENNPKNYQIIFNHLTNNKHTYKFFIFGVSSAFFLFFHVLFLGMDIENEYFKTLRRIIIALFILFELAAQFFLVRRIIIIKDQLEKFTNKNIINAKIIFITIILIISFIIVGILATYDLPKKVDYFLEWDYFLFLLFFYLLSSIMWRKNY